MRQRFLHIQIQAALFGILWGNQKEHVTGHKWRRAELQGRHVRMYEYKADERTGRFIIGFVADEALTLIRYCKA